MEISRRRRAGKISKHVMSFWTKVDKLVVFKHRSQLEAKRREAMDRHLTFLVAQTERYSSRYLLTDGSSASGSGSGQGSGGVRLAACSVFKQSHSLANWSFV